MEDVLRRLHRDAAAPKMVTIRTACTAAIEMLENEELSSKIPACDLREKCLEPLQLALESRAKKLSVHVIAGLQQILKDERFQSNIEVDDEEKWLPVQVLNAVYFTPNLPEEAQVEIMKLLLSMTFSISWCMNAKVITKVAQLYFDCYGASHRSEAGKVAAASFNEMLATFCSPQKQVKDGDDILADFKAGGSKTTTFESLMEDVVMIIKFLVDKLGVTQSAPQLKIVQPLLLEGIYAIVSHVPLEIRHHEGFKELVWKSLCPSVISLLGSPKMEKSSWQQKCSTEEVGRGSGCSASAPSILSSSAKVIYSIASELVRLVGSLGSLRPVLESLYHRMLLYPPPQHRLDALKIIRELLGSTERVLDLSGPFIPEDEHKAKKTCLTDISLIKLVTDSLQECCHCNESSVCFTSIQCVDNLLTSLEKMSRGEHLTQSVIDALLQFSTQTENECDIESKNTKEKKVVKDISNYDDNNEDDDGGTSMTYKPADHPPHSSARQDKYDGDPEPEYDDQEEDLSSNRATRITKLRLADIGSQSSSEYGDMINVQETIQSQLAEQQSQELTRRRNLLRDKFEAIERENARRFVQELERILPELLAAFSVRDVNEALEEFASNFCAGLVKQCEVGETDEPDVQAAAAVILNADGVYMASISALLLALKLTSNGYYNTKNESTLPFNEKDFMDEILSSGLLLFLSPAWLSEVYKQIISTSLLESAGFDPTKYSPLVNMLKDIDGLGSHEIGAQLMSESLDTETSMNKPADGPAVEAGKKLSRHLLSACWYGVLDVLSVLLNGKSSCGINVSLGLMLGTEGAKEESIKARDAICLSLTGLQKAANLCCILGLQERCGSAFNQLANTSCIKEDVRSPWPGEAKLHGKTSVLPTKTKLVRLHAVHVLSMDVVMTTGMEMGSHSADCWKHVFRCCAHISELEHTYFSGGNNQSNLPKVQQEQKSDANNSEDIDGMDMYSASVSIVPVAPRINVAELIRQTSIESGWEGSLLGGGVLNAPQASKALCGLSQEVDRLFEDAAEKLNLQGLLTFLAELGESSRFQLRRLRSTELEGIGSWSRLPTNALHLYRLQEVLMKIAHSSRPLLHLVRVWSVVSPYLVEATNSRDRAVTKMSVTCVHDFIVAMLSGHEEKPHFHINEFLCKTFEDMLCMEICDGDVQDQIVCSICELVEACTAQIHSGWRPLFGALRSVKIEYTASEEVNEARQHHVAAVLDVFEVFLDTNNILIFANATVDCILCLLKYVQGPASTNEKSPKIVPDGIFEELSDEESDSGSDLCSPSGDGENLCIPALKYLQRCCNILASMWKMPACPIFKGAHRIQLGSTVKMVDTNIPNMNFEAFSKFFESDDDDWVKIPLPDDGIKTEVVFEKCSNYVENKPASNKQRDSDQGYDDQSVTSADSGMLDMLSLGSCPHDCVPGEPVEPSSVASLPLTLDKLDNHSGILHVWFLLLDGLATSISSCPKSFQPKTIEMLYELLRSAADVPGPRFAVYCVNHLLLPMLQSWLRRGARICGYWEAGAVNFKQCCGHMSDLVVDYICRFKALSEEHPYLELMLRQSLDVMIECIAQPVENISRLGCSCIRHVLLSSGPCFTESMWQISGKALQRALDATTFSLRQIMMLFHVNSDNFYGDIGQVKVATRKGCTIMECLRLRQLAQQVFLLESQVSAMPQVQFDMDEGQSYVFLLYPQNHKDSLNPDHIVTRIPFRNIVIGMLSHQLLLQTVGSLLLETAESKSDHDTDKEHKMPGLLQYMSTSSVMQLMNTLQKAYNLACDFDSRPGLKFLIQKVAGLEVAANLYKLAGASTVLFVHTLVEICSHLTGLTLERTRSLLSNPQTDADSIDWVTRGRNSQEKISSNQIVFLNLLQSTCMELCQKYVDILLDKDDCSRFDAIADHSLFFLIAQSEDSSKSRHESENSPTDVQSEGFITTPVGIQSPEADETSSHVSDPVTEPSNQGDSPSPTHTRSKREMRQEEGSKVYTVASDKVIQNLMQEYKRRKQQKSMPAFVRLSKRKKADSLKSAQKETVDQDIDKQQKSSILKDSEAHVLSWSEMLKTVLNLFLILDDNQFRALLPAVFNCVNQLICHADDPKLKDILGQWFNRLGQLYEFCPKDTVAAPKQ
ncbi:brefeldin A-inhibited guanine nucleotide-exchange protein 3-like isoform X2 [Gigantopelta aegis]|uniref:brefeldin A-inhibited guanine nucleotide-exchange protein 3-like isoform X2 n=1 Tax=Gigantopelta aegis TaxID=1735272 RepID=UPI001B88DDB9|nr:brefeldin A-inhibited guanine nucleotide-exchange protein 3-like isoform X2 [Gigantopelta aegis]